MSGDRSVAMYKPTVRTISPMKIPRKPLLRTTGVMRTNIHGITARSAKGRTLFPGRITAKKMQRGTRMNEMARVTGCPTPTAESRPIYIFPRFLKCLLTNVEAASEIGSRPSISKAAIFGISTNTAPSETPNDNTLVMEAATFPPSQYARTPITSPITVPTKIGSPNTPNFFWSVSVLISISRTPGILSKIQLKSIAIGAYAVVNPWGKETPGI